MLVLAALLAVALCGMVAFSIDYGNLALQRRRAQNAADAAALAGGARLPGDTTAARLQAIDWAGRNGFAQSEVWSVTFGSVNFTNDTITVTTRRTVPYRFARVLGLDNGTVTTSATVSLFVVQGVDTDGAGVFPYAVWGGNKGGPAAVRPGVRVTYRSNSYANINVQANPSGCKSPLKPWNNCNWNIGSNTFKGYFHWHNRYTYIDPTSTQVEDQGGNAFGGEPIDELIAAQQSDTPVWLPLISYADNAGTDLNFVIVNFVCVDLDPIDTSGGSDWTGVILDPGVDARCHKSAGLKTGGQDPPTNLWALYTYQLTQ